MSGTQSGGLRAAATNRMRYGNEYYNVIGRMGGKSSTKGGFASTRRGVDGLTGPERARIVGKRFPTQKGSTNE
jgi:hypothetical protein